MGKITKLLTVVIPAYNEERTISACIKSVLSQDYRPLEVLVVDDCSKDGTAEIAAAFRRVKVVRHQKNEGLAASLNDGLKRAKGGLVMALHADCELVGRDWITRVVGHFSKNDKLAVVSGRPVFSGGDSGSFAERAFTILRMQFLADGSGGVKDIPFFEDKCDVYDKKAVFAVGGFPSSRFRISGEDQIVSYSLRKAGYRIVRDNALQFIQRHGTAASTFIKNLKREWVYGKTQAGITMSFGLFQFQSGGSGEEMKMRIRYRVSKILFALLFPLIIAAGFPVAAIGLLLLRYFWFLMLIGKTPTVRLGIAESAVLPLIGILTDFVYSFGFGAGFLLSLTGKKLL